eukprot:382578-Amphidinium_carterae.1
MDWWNWAQIAGQSCMVHATKLRKEQVETSAVMWLKRATWAAAGWVNGFALRLHTQGSVPNPRWKALLVS